MTHIRFFGVPDRFSGFLMSGHSGAGDEGSDIVCAAVSSAAYMAANTITEVMGIRAIAQVSEARFDLRLPSGAPDEAVHMLQGLFLHLSELAEQYPDYISIEQAEV